MTTGRYSRRQLKKKASTSSVPTAPGPLSMGAVLGASLVLHLAVGLIVMSGIQVGRFERAPIVTMSVDLVSAPPVVAPKRGEGGTAESIREKSLSASPIKSTSSQKPIPVPTKKKSVSHKSTSASVPKIDSKDDAGTDEWIENAKRKRDRDAVEKGINDLKQKALADKERQKQSAGTTDGVGTEAGGAIADWARAGLQSKWNLSKYQLTSFDLVTKVVIEYDKSGRMVRFELKSRSGNKVFDDSIFKALKAFSEERLPTTYAKNLKGSFAQEFTLTPKDLQD